MPWVFSPLKKVDFQHVHAEWTGMGGSIWNRAPDIRAMVIHARCNRHVPASRTDHVALLAAEVRPLAGWLEAMLSTLDSREHAFCAGGLHLSTNVQGRCSAGLTFDASGLPVSISAEVTPVRRTEFREVPAIDMRDHQAIRR